MRHNSSPAGLLSRLPHSLIVMALVLLALLPSRVVVTLEAGDLDNLIEVSQAEADALALVPHVADPLVEAKATYLVPDGTARLGESPVVSFYPRRGPPAIS